MTDEHSRTAPGRLTNSQATRADFARRDLDFARSEDLAQLDAARLILLVERLRGRLADVLDLVDEMTDHRESPNGLCGPTTAVRDHALR
jgi:hypothetical protein